MEVTLVSVLAVVALYLIHLFFKKKYSFFEKQGIVGPTPLMPFGNFFGVGISVHFIDRINEIYRNYHKKDTMAGFFMFTQPIYLIMDLELIKNILIRDFTHFHDRGLYHNENTDPLSAHLFSLGGERWKTLRAKMTSTFSSGKIKSMFPTLTNVSNNFVDVVNEKIDNNETINYRDMCSRYMSDIIGLVAFGLECNAMRDQNSKIMRMSNFLNFTEWNQRIRFIFANAYQDLSRKMGFQVTPSYIQDFFLKVITDTVEYREKNNIDRNDFLSLLIQLKNTGKLDGDEKIIGKISFTDLAAQSFVMFLAGFETSSSALSYTLYELALNPEIQDKTRREINKVLDEYNGEVTYEAINSMDYVGQVINESMRKYSSGNILLRQCTKEYKVPNTNRIIEKGRPIFIPMHAIHNNPEFFPDPDRFDPDRFTPEQVKKRNPMTFLPFGEGPRNCMGIRFGILQTRMGLVTLIKNFKFTLNEKTISPIKFNPKVAVMQPLGGIHLNTERV